ncbi:PEP-CTERM sorting domain-containing protein [Haloferula sp.]|uniref:PEP-CTERM sorting domain-containing protein n=1 Tax=Haloferula sp. TaxID=2497595 RepID=UPI0032A141A7
MKLVKIALIGSLLAAATANGTTVTAGGGTGGAQFFTSGGSILTNLNSAFATGIWNGTNFVEFAPLDATPIAISTIGIFAGRWSGNSADTSNAADAFGGAPIWFRVTTDADGGGVAYFSGSEVFPNNGGGVGDSISVNSTTLETLGVGSSAGSRAYQAGDGQIIIGTVPEPSIALLGALGVLGLVRRRR